VSVWLALFPLLLASAGVLVALGFDGYDQRVAAIASVVVSLLAAAGVSGWMAVRFDLTLVGSANIAVGVGYSAVSAVVFLIAAITLVGGSMRNVEIPAGGQIAALTGLLAVAASLLISSRDVLIIIIALEAVGVTSYALVSVGRQRRTDEAAMKYFIQGAATTGLVLYALSILYGLFGGSLLLGDISASVGASSGRPALLALALLIVTYAFKLGAFPFHSWALDAYETTTPSTTSFLATAPKIAILGSLMVVMPLVGFSAKGFATTGFMLFALLATASIIFGNFGALRQLAFTRMLAYSGIAQVGYVLIGVAAAFLLAPASRTGLAVIVAGVTYALAASAAFMGAQAVRAVLPAWDGGVSGLAGLARKRPALSAAMTVSLLSLTGIPLTAGFWGKFGVFVDAVSVGSVWLVVIGLIGSVVSFGYYGGVIKSMYLDEPVHLPALSVGADRAADGAPDLGAEAAAIVLAVLVLALGILPLVYGFSFLNSVFVIA